MAAIRGDRQPLRRGPGRSRMGTLAGRPSRADYNARPCRFHAALKKSDFHYDLPPGLIAQAPLPERSASRLLVVPPGDAPIDDRRVRDLPELLREGDLLVFNDTG